MNDILTFVADNSVQTFFLGPFVLIVLGILLFFLNGILSVIFRIINRVLRTIKVIFRGWPPEHLDADGDSLTQINSEEFKDMLKDLEETLESLKV